MAANEPVTPSIGIASISLMTRLQNKSDTAQNWSLSNPLLLEGEIGYESDTNKFKIGTGNKEWNELPYFANDSIIYGGEKTLDQINSDTSLCVKNMIYKISNGGAIKKYLYNNDNPTYTGTYNISAENNATKYSIKYSAVDYTNPAKYQEMNKFIGVCEKDVIIHITYTYTQSSGSSINLEADVICSDRNGPTIYLKDKIIGIVAEVESGTTVKITKVYKTLLTVNSNDCIMWNGSEWVSFSSSIPIINNLTSTDKNKSLSANQGKVLNDKITKLDNKITKMDTSIGSKFEETGTGVGVKSEYEFTADTINTNNIAISGDTDTINFHDSTGNYTLTDVLNKKLYYYGNIDISSNAPVIYSNNEVINTWPTQAYGEVDGKIYTVMSKFVDKGLDRSDLGIDRLETKISGLIYIVFKYDSSNGNLSIMNIINPDKCVPTLKKLTIKIASITINNKNYKINTTYTPDFSDIDYNIILGSGDVSYTDGTGGDGTAYAELLNYMTTKSIEQVSYIFTGSATDCMILNTNSVYVGESIYWNGLCWAKLSPDMSKYYNKDEIINLGHISYQGAKTESELNSIDNSSDIKTKGYMYNVQFNGDSAEIENYTYHINGSVEPGTIKQYGNSYIIKYSAENFTNPDSSYDELRRLIGSMYTDCTIYGYINGNLQEFIIQSISGPNNIEVTKISGPSFTDNSSIDIQAVLKNKIAVYNTNDYIVWDGTDWKTISRSININDIISKTHTTNTLEISKIPETLNYEIGSPSVFIAGDQYVIVNDDTSTSSNTVSYEATNEMPHTFNVTIMSLDNNEDGPVGIKFYNLYDNIPLGIYDITTSIRCEYTDDDDKTWIFEIDDINKYNSGDISTAYTNKKIRIIYDGNLATATDINTLKNMVHNASEIELAINNVTITTFNIKVGDTLTFLGKYWHKTTNSTEVIDALNYKLASNPDGFYISDILSDTISSQDIAVRNETVGQKLSFINATDFSGIEYGEGTSAKNLQSVLDKKADKDDLTSVYKVKGSLNPNSSSSPNINSWTIGIPKTGDVYNISADITDNSIKGIANSIWYDTTIGLPECTYIKDNSSSNMAYLDFTDKSYNNLIGNCKLVLATTQAAIKTIAIGNVYGLDTNNNRIIISSTGELTSGTKYYLYHIERDRVPVKKGDNVVWIDNYGWDKLAADIDLSNYVTKTDAPLSKIYHVTEGNKDIIDIDTNSYLRVPYFDKIIDSKGSSIQTELNNKLDKSAVVNTLTSSSTTNPLSAEQGRVLNVTTVKMTGNQQISGYKYFSQGLFATYPINRNNNPFDDSTDPTTISPTAVINYQYLENYSNSKKFKPSQIMPQNDSTSGIVPLTYGAETHSVRNVSSFLPANAISIEYTTDGGTTWTDYGASDEVKRKIFAEDTTNYIKIGGKNITTDTITDQCMTRVTIDPVVDGRYSNAFMFYCWVTTSGVKDMKCKIECSTIGAPDTFTTVRDEVTVSGWSGPNTITFSTKSFGGGANQTSNQCKYRFTFRSLQPNNKIASFTDLRLYGYSVWTPKNNYMKAGTIYSTSYDQNVIFPAQLSANTLEIGTNGTIGTNLTNAIQSITNDIPVATTVPATLAVNTIYDVGQQTTLNLTLPSGKVGNYIQVDFLSPSTPTTLGINSAAGISDFSLVPSANTIYSLYFEWGTLYYNSTTSKCVYGWRFKYDEYTHTV